jgi:hypothetical protein
MFSRIYCGHDCWTAEPENQSFDKRDIDSEFLCVITFASNHFENPSVAVIMCRMKQLVEKGAAYCVEFVVPNVGIDP